MRLVLHICVFFFQTFFLTWQYLSSPSSHSLANPPPQPWGCSLPHGLSGLTSLKASLLENSLLNSITLKWKWPVKLYVLSSHRDMVDSNRASSQILLIVELQAQSSLKTYTHIYSSLALCYEWIIGMGLIKIIKMLQSLADFAQLRPDDHSGYPPCSLSVLQQQSALSHNREV